jgi:hypothetical protein
MTVGQVEKLSQQCDGRRNEKRACEERVRLRRRRAGELVFNDISAPSSMAIAKKKIGAAKMRKAPSRFATGLSAAIRTPGITRDLSMALPPSAPVPLVAHRFAGNRDTKTTVPHISSS